MSVSYTHLDVYKRQVYGPCSAVYGPVNGNLQSFNPTDMKLIVLNIKPYIHTSILHSVDARRIFLIRRSGDVYKRQMLHRVSEPLQAGTASVEYTSKTGRKSQDQKMCIRDSWMILHIS